MKCNNCNAEIADGSRFCPNCGAQFQAPSTMVNGGQPYGAPQQPYGQQQYPANPYPAPGLAAPKRNNSVMIVAIIAVAVVVVIGIIAAVILVGGDKKQEQAQTEAKNDTVVVYQQMPSTAGVASKQEREQMAGGGSVGRIKNVGFTGDFSDIACYTWLTDDDVRGLSKSQLRVLRNTIYARHGRKFKSADLRQYFSQFSWYNPRYDEISPSALSKTEQHNITLIQRYE